MKKFRMTAVLLMLLALLTACSSSAAVRDNTPQVSQPVQVMKSVRNIDLDQALNAVKHTINLDYSKYQIDLINDSLIYDGQEFYQFLISDREISIEPSVIVSKDNGEIFCYYPDKTVTEVYQDEVFKSKC